MRIITQSYKHWIKIKNRNPTYFYSLLPKKEKIKQYLRVKKYFKTKKGKKVLKENCRRWRVKNIEKYRKYRREYYKKHYSTKARREIMKVEKKEHILYKEWTKICGKFIV